MLADQIYKIVSMGEVSWVKEMCRVQYAKIQNPKSKIRNYQCQVT